LQTGGKNDPYRQTRFHVRGRWGPATVPRRSGPDPGRDLQLLRGIHPSHQPANAAHQEDAARSRGANLQNPVIPKDGFTVDSVGVATTNGNTNDGHALVQALAAHDVVIIAKNTRFTQLLTTADQKIFQEWAVAKGHGVVAFHGATDDANTTWPWKIAYFGGKFTEHSYSKATVLMDTTPAL
jgi:hypothetical protein